MTAQPNTLPANKAAIERVAIILSSAIQNMDDHETALRDLLADIRHYCDDQDIDFHNALRVSYDNYLEELPLEKLRAASWSAL